MNDLSKLLELKTGRKYTLVGMSDIGFPYQKRMVITYPTDVMPYAQYPQSYVVTFREVGKRKDRQIRFYDNMSVIVWDGWVYPKTEMFVDVDQQVDVNDYDTFRTVRKSLACFDPQYMKIARFSVSQEPLIECIEKRFSVSEK